jgi:thioredoxin family protein
MISESEVFRRARTGLSVAAFIDEWKEELEQPATGLDREGRLHRHYTRYNWDRYESIRRKHKISAAFADAIRRVPGVQTWLVITEHWCSDAAFSVPVIQAAAECHSDVDLRILYRDENPEVMDRYLTGESRSIPILAVFDDQGHELLRWGSKPKAAAIFRKDLVRKATEPKKLSLTMVEWYEDGGWLEVEQELTEAFNSILHPVADSRL